jgi:thiamine pyrophosphate-dependent acetolactate synthase large subunit-like protein
VDHRERAALWRTAAAELRQRPQGSAQDPGPVAVQGIARLLESLANTVQRGASLSNDVVTVTDEIARHIHRYVPGHDPGSGPADHPASR